MTSQFKTIAKNIFRFVFPRKNQARRYIYLFETIEKIKPKTLLEIGVWNGRRGVEMIRCAQKLNKDNIQYFGTDLFEEMNNDLFKSEFSKRPPIKEEVESRLKKTGAKISLIAGNTTETLPKVAPSLPLMDFIFIDGGHAVETITNDWKYASRVLSEEGVLIFDDYYPDREDVGAKPVVDSIDRNIYNVDILPILDIFEKPEGTLKINFVRVSRR